MKICIISTPIFPVPLPGYGGLEQIAWERAKGLAALGHQVALVTPFGSHCPGVEIIPIQQGATEKAAFEQYRPKLSFFDVIVDDSWQKWSYVAKLEGLQVPVLGVMHAPVNTMYQTLPDLPKPCFVCISHDQHRHFEAFHGKTAEVAYNGVDPEFYKPLPIKRSSRFLFLARFSEIKGADLAIEACKEVGVGLDLVGDTSITNEPAFLDKIQKMADGKQIRFVGPQNRGNCVWWYSQAHVFLHPNKRFREPFGLAPVEALMCGCPVIAWDYGSMSEIATYRCDSMESLVETITIYKGEIDTGQRQHLRQRASDKFSTKKMVERYEELCDLALEGGW